MWCCKLIQEPVAGEAVELQGEPTNSTFLKQYNFHLYYKYVSSYQKIAIVTQVLPQQDCSAHMPVKGVEINRSNSCREQSLLYCS